MSGSLPPSQGSQQQGNVGNGGGMNSQMDSLPFSSSSTLQPSFQFSQNQQGQNSQSQTTNASEISAFSAIHTPIDFGDMTGGGAGGGGGNDDHSQLFSFSQQQNSLMPPMHQQQFLGPNQGAIDFSGQASGFASPMMYMSTPAMTDGSAGVSGTSTPLAKNNDEKKPVKPRAPKKQKTKAKEDEGQIGGANATEGEGGDDANAESKSKKQTKKPKKAAEENDDSKEPKKAKPRKPKAKAIASNENGDISVGNGLDAPTPGTIDLQSASSPAVGEGGTGTNKRAKAGTGKAKSGRGRGGASANNSRRPSQANMDISMGDEESFSRAGSIAPATGESTPTKRGGKTSSGLGGRGGRGGKRRSTAGRAGSRGSRATSGRATASVVPGQESGTAAPEDVGRVADRGEDDDDDGTGAVGGGDDAEEEIDDEEEEEDFDQGLEEDELDRQEAIQRQRAINMGPLMKAMTEEQQDRYSAFRRHYLDKRFVKRLLHHLTRQTVIPQVNTLVAGVGKVFIGEIVEGARKVRQEQLDSTLQTSNSHQQPLRPDHLIEALRRYREESELPGHYPPGTPNAGAGVSANGKRRRLF